MKGLIKRWVKEALSEREGGDVVSYPKYEPPRTPEMTAHQAVVSMATSMGTIYRIDNGFIVFVNMNSDAHSGARGSLLYAKDAQEVAEKIIACEAAFKIGAGASAHVGYDAGVERGGLGGGSSAKMVLHKPGGIAPDIWNKNLLKIYKEKL